MLRTLLAPILCLLLATSAGAQLASQTGLVGTVTDSGGGVLPGATVTAVNVGTKATLSCASWRTTWLPPRSMLVALNVWKPWRLIVIS